MFSYLLKDFEYFLNCVEISRLGMTLAPKEKPLVLRINGNIDFKFSENPLKAMFEPCSPRKQFD